MQYQLQIRPSASHYAVQGFVQARLNMRTKQIGLLFDTNYAVNIMLLSFKDLIKASFLARIFIQMCK